MSNAFELTVNALRKQGLNSDEILEEMSELFQKLAQTNKAPAKPKTTEEKIRRLLKRAGMPIHVKGYECWVEAMRIYKQNESMKMSQIYKEVADIHGTTPSAIERLMRYAAGYAFKNYPKNNIESFFGSKAYIDKEKLSNIEFLTILADKI